MNWFWENISWIAPILATVIGIGAVSVWNLRNLKILKSHSERFRISITGVNPTKNSIYIDQLLYTLVEAKTADCNISTIPGERKGPASQLDFFGMSVGDVRTAEIGELVDAKALFNREISIVGGRWAESDTATSASLKWRLQTSRGKTKWVDFEVKIEAVSFS